MNWARIIGLGGILAILIWIAFGQLRTLQTLGNNLSPLADPWTESDTLRAGEGFASLGFAANAGLPDLCFGERFADKGTERVLGEPQTSHKAWRDGTLDHRDAATAISAERFVYTHYPPGPHWIVGIMTSAFGPGKTALYRWFPLLAGWIAIAFLALQMVRRFGELRAAVMLIFLTAIPMFTNMMHGLSYQGYAFALLVLELALSLRLIDEQHPPKRILFAMAAIGFCQGWLGFDYAFVIASAPVCVWLAVSTHTAPRRAIVWASVLAGAGFAAAHVMHFMQVALYLGSLEGALRDFFSAAQYRAAADTLDRGQDAPTPLGVLWSYLNRRTSLPPHFNAPILVLLSWLWCSLWLLHKLLSDRSDLRRRTMSIAAALVTASLWIVLMPQHSAQHWHFIPRLYFLPIFITILCIATVTQHVRVNRDSGHIAFLAAMPGVICVALLRDAEPTESVLAFANLAAAAAYATTSAILLSWIARWPAHRLRPPLYAPLMFWLLLLPYLAVEEALLNWRGSGVDGVMLTWISSSPSILAAGCVAASIAIAAHAWRKRPQSVGDPVSP